MSCYCIISVLHHHHVLFLPASCLLISFLLYPTGYGPSLHTLRREEIGIWKAHTCTLVARWGELPYVETTVQDGPGDRRTLGVRVRNRSASGREAEAKYQARRDQVLATIVLAVETSLLYLLRTLLRYGNNCQNSFKGGHGQTSSDSGKSSLQ